MASSWNMKFFLPIAEHKCAINLQLARRPPLHNAYSHILLDAATRELSMEVHGVQCNYRSRHSSLGCLLWSSEGLHSKDSIKAVENNLCR